MQTGSGTPMFMIQPRDLVRVRNISNAEIGLAGIIRRFAPTADVVVWGQTFMHSGMYKEWERDRIAVEKIAANALGADQLEALNRTGQLNSSELKLPGEATPEAQPVKKKAEKKPEPEAPVASEPETTPAPEPVAEAPEEAPAEEEAPMEEEASKPKAKKKKKASKKKSEE